MTKEGLLQKAKQAQQHAYTPYSQYQVGAALLCKDESVFYGCNIENASYGLTMCAERVAMYQAIANGHRDFVAMAIVGSGQDFAAPCGACRQVMAEFAPDMEVYIGLPVSEKYIETTVRELLPLQFVLIENDEVKE